LLSEYGVDLALWFRQRRWVALLELIWQLPNASRFNEAQLNDPEYAEIAARAQREAEISGRPAAKWTPPVREWTLEAQLLREIRESIIAVRSAQYETTYLPAGEGRLKALRAPVVPVLPGPETEADRVRARLSRQSQLEIIAIFAPHALTNIE